MLKIAYVTLLIAIVTSVSTGWWLSVPRRLPGLPGWRRGLLFVGLTGNTALLTGLLAVVFQVAVMSEGVNMRNYRILFPVGLASVVLGVFGKRLPRVLVVGNGLVLTFLWLQLAASSL